MLAAIRNKKPDRVPCCPDMSNMIPCRLTGHPFWDVYYWGNPPLWQAEILAIDYFGFDGLFVDWYRTFVEEPKVEVTDTIVSQTPERLVVRYRYRTPDGDLFSEKTYYVADSPTTTLRPVRDLRADMKRLRHLFAEPLGLDEELIHHQRNALGERGVFGLLVAYPGFQNWTKLFDGSLETMTYLYYDTPELMEELRELHERRALKEMEIALDQQPDFILLGGSGTITLQSPTIARQLSLPTIKKITRMGREAGIPTMLHSCGKEYALVKMCAEETDLDCINPLEPPPMGDCDLAQIKAEFGDRLSLMGNLHTTEVMLFGTPDDVERAARKAIDDAAVDGGFILSTGDQCGRDTPDANILKMVEVAKTYGCYE